MGPASINIYFLLITFADSLDPYQAQQDAGPDLGPNFLIDLLFDRLTLV